MLTSLLGAPIFVIAVVCLLLNGVLIALDRPWRAVELGTQVLVLLCIIIGLSFAAIERHGWPLLTMAEVILGSVAGALLWSVLLGLGRASRWEALLFSTVIAGLFVWGIVRWSDPAEGAMLHPIQQFWLFAAHFALALACGAFVGATSRALACLLAERRQSVHTNAEWNIEAERYALLLGLPCLTASLLLTALGGQCTRGVYWSWTATTSWQLFTWFFYAVIWCAFVLLGWRSRQLWSLTALGLIPSLLMLKAVGG